MTCRRGTEFPAISARSAECAGRRHDRSGRLAYKITPDHGCAGRAHGSWTPGHLAEIRRPPRGLVVVALAFGVGAAVIRLVRFVVAILLDVDFAGIKEVVLLAFA